MSDIQYAHEPSSADYDYQLTDQCEAIQPNSEFQLPIYDNLVYDVTDGFVFEHPENQHISLKNRQLWSEFHAITNEMLVVRSGRALYPKLECEFKELCESAEYVVGVRMMLQSPNKWKYFKGADGKRRWIANLDEERIKLETNEVFTGVMSGKEAMSEGFDMSWIKIFNLGEKCIKKEQDTDNNMIRVVSQFKYIPIITLYQFVTPDRIEAVSSAMFPETEFIVVTGYKNSDCLDLKKGNKFVPKHMKTPPPPESVVSSESSTSPAPSGASTPSTSSSQEITLSPVYPATDYTNYYTDYYSNSCLDFSYYYPYWQPDPLYPYHY